jgi:hypothetical protein
MEGGQERAPQLVEYHNVLSGVGTNSRSNLRALAEMRQSLALVLKIIYE